MKLPEILEDTIFGTLIADEDDEEGNYYGQIDIYGESIPIGFFVDPDKYEYYRDNLFQNAFRALNWINSNRRTLFEQAAEDLVEEYDKEDRDDFPIWYDMFQEQVKKVLPSIKLMNAYFNADEGFSLTFDDGRYYGGNYIKYSYIRPNEMDEWGVFEHR